MGIIERSYGRIMKTAFKAVNPIKKMIIKTECKVHKFINHQSVEILKNDSHLDAYEFFRKHMEDLNSGVVWADQDLKSSNHFYNPEKEKGLYGYSNALKECLGYYGASLKWGKNGDMRKAIFYLGAACHLVQDITVPQHANVRLLKHHRRYEQWVLRAYGREDSFKCWDKGLYFNTARDFIEENAKVAINTHNKNKHISNLEKRFFNITDVILCQAQRSTAGFLDMFYRDVCNLKERLC